MTGEEKTHLLYSYNFSGWQARYCLVLVTVAGFEGRRVERCKQV
jgi:hypothetical protein